MEADRNELTPKHSARLRSREAHQALATLKSRRIAEISLDEAADAILQLDGGPEFCPPHDGSVVAYGICQSEARRRQARQGRLIGGDIDQHKDRLPPGATLDPYLVASI